MIREPRPHHTSSEKAPRPSVEVCSIACPSQPADIADFDLNLYDTQPAALTGAHGEFLCSARLDNLVSSYLALEALTAADVGEALTANRGVGVPCPTMA